MSSELNNSEKKPRREPNRGLTNESLYKRFDSKFDLVGYAIDVARNRVVSGREPTIRTNIQNTAYQVLAEISDGKEVILTEEEIEERQRQERLTRQELIRAVADQQDDDQD